MINPRVESDFIHDRDTSLCNLFLKLLHRWADITCRDYIDLFPDRRLDNEGMVGIWNQADGNWHDLSTALSTSYD